MRTFMGSLELSPLLWWLPDQQQSRIHLTLSLVNCKLTKQGERFLTKLAVIGTGNHSATNNLMRRFIESSSKSVALSTLSHLLSPNTTHPHLYSLASHLYARISEASWFDWNPKLVAELVALLDKQGKDHESKTLILETVSKLKFREREITLFYCNLIESYSNQSSGRGFDKAYSYLNRVLVSSSSVYTKRRAYEHMVCGLCAVGRPVQAENLVDDMRSRGIEPSVFEFRSILYGYGRLGLFKDMERMVEQMEKQGFGIDTICSNMVLSSYGAHNELGEVVSWLRKMKISNVPFSVRTYNSVSNSCPAIMGMLLKNLNGIPLSIQQLNGSLKGDEALVVCELVRSLKILEEIVIWDSLETKLDLHGLHVGASYLIILMWFQEMKQRFRDSEYVVPKEVVVVCGSGKHSKVRGESPVKKMVKDIVVHMRSPLRIDKSGGSLRAKGKAVRDWLLQ